MSVVLPRDSAAFTTATSRGAGRDEAQNGGLAVWASVWQLVLLLELWRAQIQLDGDLLVVTRNAALRPFLELGVHGCDGYAAFTNVLR